MRRKVHWSEVMQCSCGMKFTDMAREAVHRHNFPALCKKRKTRNKKEQHTNARGQQMTDEMDAAIDRLRDTLRAENVGQVDVVSATMQAKDAQKPEWDLARAQADIASLMANLAAEQALADRLWDAWQFNGYAPDAVAAYQKARWV